MLIDKELCVNRIYSAKRLQNNLQITKLYVTLQAQRRDG